MEAAKSPSGVVAILTRADGVVIASVVDCERQSPGGVSVEEAQSYRARQSLANATIRAMCSDDVAEVVRGYDAQQIMDSLVRVKGYRVTTMPVGGAEA